MDKPILPTSPVTESSVAPHDCKCPKMTQPKIYSDEDESKIHASIELENQLQNFVYVKYVTLILIEKLSFQKSYSYFSRKHPTRIRSHPAEPSANKSDLNRRRRDLIEGDPSNSFMLRDMQNAAKNTNETAKTKDIPGTRMDVEGKYIIDINAAVNATTFEFVFDNLKHFSWYTIRIEACRETEPENNASECSRDTKLYMRTLMLRMYMLCFCFKFNLSYYKF